MTRLNMGDKDTFYCHVLTKYVPHILKITYERHKLGIGIFSMEGFEYKNYTSKQVLNNRTNGKVRTNICLQSMRVLQLLFDCEYHDLEVEVKRRKKESEKRIEEYEKVQVISEQPSALAETDDNALNDAIACGVYADQVV